MINKLAIGKIIKIAFQNPLNLYNLYSNNVETAEESPVMNIPNINSPNPIGRMQDYGTKSVQSQNHGQQISSVEKRPQVAQSGQNPFGRYGDTSGNNQASF